MSANRKKPPELSMLQIKADIVAEAMFGRDQLVV